MKPLYLMIGTVLMFFLPGIFFLGKGIRGLFVDVVNLDKTQFTNSNNAFRIIAWARTLAGTILLFLFLFLAFIILKH